MKKILIIENDLLIQQVILSILQSNNLSTKTLKDSKSVYPTGFSAYDYY